MEQAVIVSAVRTPVGTFGGYFKDVPATELGTTRSGRRSSGPGSRRTRSRRCCSAACCRPGLGQNPARQAAIGAGHPEGGARDDHQHAAAARG